jgi:putative nucleotidyltransferase with HDIG domain
MSLTEPQKIALQLAAETFGDGKLWLVGGWVRDALLERAADDIDLAVEGSPSQVLSLSRQFSNTVQAHLPGWKVSYFPLDTDNGVARIIFFGPDSHFYADFAALQQNSLETDLRRRDFTINALAIPLDSYLENGSLAEPVDFVGGLADLKANLLRPVSEANLISDPLRMLRGARQRAQLTAHSGQEWQLAPGTVEMFRRNASLIKQPAGERVQVEFNKLFLAGGLEPGLRLLDKCGLLSPLLPELDEGRECVQMPAHYYDVFNHSLVTVDRMEWLVFPDYRGESVDAMALAQRPEEIVTHWPEVVQALFEHHGERFIGLVWGAILHDVGKPRTRTVDVQGKIHFYTHPKIGAEMARAILERLHYSRHTIENVAKMVEHHLRLGQLGEHYDPISQGGVTRRAIYKFLRDTEPVQLEMMPLSLADHAAVVGPWIAQARQLRSWERHLWLTDKVSRTLLGTDEEKLVGKPKLLDGRTLMETLSLSPGPVLGKLLREVEEAQAVGEIDNLTEALELARTLLDTGFPPPEKLPEE